MGLEPKIIEEAEDLVLELSEGRDEDRERIAKAVAQFLDVALPFEVLFPGPAGKLVEAGDEKVFEFLVSSLMKVFHADPEKKAERKQRREKRRLQREERRLQKRIQKGTSDAK